MEIHERAVLPAEPRRVWDLLVDWERQASWMPDVAWIRLLGPERGPGTRMEVRTRVFGIPAATDLVTVTAWEPPHRLAIAHTGVVKGTGEWLLRDAAAAAAADPGPTTARANGTVFEWIESFRLPPPLVGDLALRAYAPWQRRMLRASIRNLTAILAGGTPPAPSATSKD